MARGNRLVIRLERPVPDFTDRLSMNFCAVPPGLPARPVALLVPVPTGSRLEQLAARGRLVPAAADLLGLGEPLEPVPQAPLPSAALAETRADER